MLPIPEEMLTPMIAVIGGLLLFAALLHLGLRVVRRLGLPQDLPEGPAYEPPPPPLVDRLSKAEAGERAGRQAERRAVWARAREGMFAAMRCAEATNRGVPDPAVRQRLIAFAATAKAAAEAAGQAMRGDDLETARATVEARVAEALLAWTGAEALVHDLPEEGARRRRILLITLVVVMVVWALVTYVLLPA